MRLYLSIDEYLQSQPLLCLAMALILGIAVGASVPAIGFTAWFVAAAVCLLATLLLRKWLVSDFILLLSVVFIGGAMMKKCQHDISFTFVAGQEVDYEAVVMAEPQIKGKTLRCDLLLTAVGGKQLHSPVAVKASVLRDTVDNRWRQLRLGGGIRGRSSMKPLANYRNGSNFDGGNFDGSNFDGGNFDYVRWLQCHGFRAQTFVSPANWEATQVSLASLPRLSRLSLWALQFRKMIVERLAATEAQSTARSYVAADADEDQQAAVVAAMVLGDKHALSAGTKDVYSVSGASHVLALSGLHLGIIYGVLFLLFGRGYKRRWLSQAAILVAIWTYVVLVGMGASVVRSAVMLTIHSLCAVAGRSKASVNALSLAAIVMLTANPLCLWDIGFQMSFMAVLAIVVLYGPIYRLMPNSLLQNTKTGVVISYMIKYVWGASAVSMAAQLGTAPLVVYYFERFSCYFLLTNYIVIPCASIIIYGALAVLIALPWPWLCHILKTALHFVASCLNGSVEWIASLPGASIDGIHISAWQLACIYAVILLVCIVAYRLCAVKDLHRLDEFCKQQ